MGRGVVKIPPRIALQQSIVHPTYRDGDGKGWDAVTPYSGVSTAILASRFMAGDTVRQLAEDYRITDGAVLDALRFEMHTRRQRVAAVRKLLGK